MAKLLADAKLAGTGAMRCMAGAVASRHVFTADRNGNDKTGAGPNIADRDRSPQRVRLTSSISKHSMTSPTWMSW